VSNDLYITRRVICDSVDKGGSMSQILLLAASFLCLGLVCAIRTIRDRKLTIRDRKVFEERFPSISDSEFLSLCRPGTKPDVALKVRRIVADQMGVKYECVYPSTRFVEDLHAD
jgi:hypothetical protein